MGGDQPDPPQATPPAPSTTETSAQAIQAQIDALPKILAAQQQYGPGFSEEQLKSLKTYGPQFAEAALKLQREYGPQFAEVERSLSPELAGAQKTLADFFAQNDEAEYQSLRPGLLEDVRGAQSQRGLGAISPLGSIDESVQLQRLKQSLKDRRMNVALSTAGRVPIGQMPTVQGQTGTGQLVNNVDPNSIFNYQSQLNNFNASIFGTQSNIFGTQSQAATARRQQNMDFGMKGFENIIGGAYLLGGCWVAAEIFGGWYEPKTVYSRIYVNTIAPKWFRDIYMKYGERFAKFIKDKPKLKNLIRPLFELFSAIGKERMGA